MAETLVIGNDVVLIDGRTGQLTRQGRIVFDILSQAAATANEVTTNLSTHIATAATTGALGHVLKAAAVSNPTTTAVAVAAADIAEAGNNYNKAYTQTIADLANELKADLTTLATNQTAIEAALESLLASLRTSGALAT